MNDLGSGSEPATALPFTADEGWVFFALALIILLSGLAGGYAAYLAEDRKTASGWDRGPPRRLRFLILGIVAAACVPLFLSLVRSEVINVIITDRNGGRLEALLVFIGLCLIAAFSSRTFIEGLTKQALQRLSAKVEQAEAVAENANEVAAEAIAELEASDQPTGAQAEMAEASAQAEASALRTGELPAVDEIELRTLKALSKTVFRTATGTAVDAGVPKNQVGEVLDSLADKGLAMITQSPRTGGVRWKITSNGIAVLQRAR